MIKWTIVLSLAALAVTYICGYLLELRHIHPAEPQPQPQPSPSPSP